MPAALFEARGQGPNGAGLLLMSELVALVGSTSSDSDGDGLPDVCDNCPDVAGTDQTDGDFDGLGDSCDPNPSDPDTFAPSISPLAQSVGAAAATLSWATNEHSPHAQDRSHPRDLGADRDTTYHYEIVAIDAAGNTTTTGNQMFTIRTPSSCGLAGVEALAVLGCLCAARRRTARPAA